MARRDALAAAVSERHRRTGRAERGLILDESAAVTGLYQVSLFRTDVPNLSSRWT